MRMSLLLGVCIAIPASLPALAGENVILDRRSTWRCHVVWRNPRVRLESGEMVEVSFGPGSPQREWSRFKKEKAACRSRAWFNSASEKGSDPFSQSEKGDRPRAELNHARFCRLTTI